MGKAGRGDFNASTFAESFIGRLIGFYKPVLEKLL